MAAAGAEPALVEHFGGCHCKAVRFKALAPANIVAWSCNCSICAMKRNDHFVVPDSKFELLSGSDSLTTYTFGSHTAQHMFCSKCGVQSFYKPRSNPDGMAITVFCVDPDTIESVETRCFDGQNWEKTIEGSAIVGMSKAA